MCCSTIPAVLLKAVTLIQPVFFLPALKARLNDAMGSPSELKWISGSLPRLPAKTTELSMIAPPFCGGERVNGWHDRKNCVMLLNGEAGDEIDRPHEFIYITGADLTEFGREP
jgi:hypothetical protein